MGSGRRLGVLCPVVYVCAQPSSSSFSGKAKREKKRDHRKGGDIPSHYWFSNPLPLPVGLCVRSHRVVYQMFLTKSRGLSTPDGSPRAGWTETVHQHCAPQVRQY